MNDDLLRTRKEAVLANQVLSRNLFGMNEYPCSFLFF